MTTHEFSSFGRVCGDVDAFSGTYPCPRPAGGGRVAEDGAPGEISSARSTRETGEVTATSRIAIGRTGRPYSTTRRRTS